MYFDIEVLKKPNNPNNPKEGEFHFEWRSWIYKSNNLSPWLVVESYSQYTDKAIARRQALKILESWGYIKLDERQKLKRNRGNQ